MYKFSPEEKRSAKELIRQLYSQYYLNPIQAMIQQRMAAEEPKDKLTKDLGVEKETTKEKKSDPSTVSYTEVKGFILGQRWEEKSTRDLAITYGQAHPQAPLAKIKQYVQRITWELRKKSSSSAH